MCFPIITFYFCIFVILSFQSSITQIKPFLIPKYYLVITLENISYIIIYYLFFLLNYLSTPTM